MTLHHYSEDASTNAKPRTCRDCNNPARSLSSILCSDCSQRAHEQRTRMQTERAHRLQLAKVARRMEGRVRG